MHASCFVESGGAVLVRETNDFELTSVVCKNHVNKDRIRICIPVMNLLKNKLDSVRKYVDLNTYDKIIGILGKTKTLN